MKNSLIHFISFLPVFAAVNGHAGTFSTEVVASAEVVADTEVDEVSNFDLEELFQIQYDSHPKTNAQKCYAAHQPGNKTLCTKNADCLIIDPNNAANKVRCTCSPVPISGYRDCLGVPLD